MLTALAALAVLGVFVLLCRVRRVSTSVEDATLSALNRVTNAAPHLREGLNQESADKAVQPLRELLDFAAVGLVDSEAALLSWDGGAKQHYEQLREKTERALRTRKREYVDHANLACDQRPCPMRHAVVVPLEVEGDSHGALVIVSNWDRKRLLNGASGLADHVTTQLELAELNESKQRLARAEVRAMRAQISPHFIYNALNTISSQIRTDPEQARDLLQEFADFTRYSFRTSGLYTTLADEIRNIDRYLNLERARFGPDRLRMQLKIAPEVLPVVMPFLALQPLVENAVRHGLANKPGGGTVSVVAEENGNEALINVEDDGIGMDPARLDEEFANAHMTGAHVGLGNINNRMRATFGDDYALVVETEQDAGMKVIMRVPKFSPGVRTVASQAFEDPADGMAAEPEPSR